MEAKNNESLLQVGFGREKIMPETPVYISGGGNPNRISTGVLDELFLTCVAMTDESDNTILLFTQDLQQVAKNFIPPALEAVTEATGVAKENIMIAATHTHSCPGQHLGRTGIKEFQQVYIASAVKAAKAAMADRSAAVISTGSTQAKGLVFVRHYLLSNGTYAGSAYGDFKSGTIVRQAYDPDETVQLIRFAREGKKDVLLMNHGSHATFNGNIKLTNISADFPNPTREYIESNSDCLVAYFLAAAGDQVPQSRHEEIDHGMEYREYGAKLGQYVVDALPTLTPAKGGKLSLVGRTFTAETNRHSLDKLEQATETYEAFLEGSYKLANPLVKKYGFQSPYEARAIFNNSRLDATIDMDVFALAVGETAFIFAPYEMFGCNGRFIRENSPYNTTFIITHANACYDYVPSDFAFEIYCYEAFAGKVARGTGEKFAQQYVDMLNELKAKQ